MIAQYVAFSWTEQSKNRMLGCPGAAESWNREVDASSHNAGRRKGAVREAVQGGFFSRAVESLRGFAERSSAKRLESLAEICSD